MKRFKEYRNLYKLYQRGHRKWVIAFFLFFLLFALSVVSIGFGMPPAIVLAIISFFAIDLFVGIMCLVMGRITARKLALFRPDELSRLDISMPTLRMEEGFAVTPDAFVHLGMGRVFCYPARDILWVYKHTITTMLYGLLPMSKDSTLMIACRDRKRYGFRVRNKSEVLEYLRLELEEYYPGILFGYNSDLDSRFPKEIDEVIYLYEAHAQQNR